MVSDVGRGSLLQLFLAQVVVFTLPFACTITVLDLIRYVASRLSLGRSCAFAVVNFLDQFQ
jgi:hypothetical protein